MNINYYAKNKKVFILLNTKKNISLITNLGQPADPLANPRGGPEK